MAVSLLENELYREKLPNPYLSKTFQSSVMHTPSHTTRRTISKENYERQIANEEKYAKTPWGRSYSYGSLGFVHLQGTPHSLNMIKLPKGAHHFGSGASQKPRGVTIQQLYPVSSTKKSSVRPTDELIPSPTKVDVIKEQIDRRFPAEHPYASHMPKTDIFPSTKSVQLPINNSQYQLDDITKKDDVLPVNCPAAAADTSILGKARGTSYRHEVVSIPFESQRKPLTWPEESSYFQVVKGPDKKRNIYYPTPPRQVNPNALQLKPLSADTQKALNQANKKNLTSTYQQDYSQIKSPIAYRYKGEAIQDKGKQSPMTNSVVQSNLSYGNLEVPRSTEILNTKAESTKRIQFNRETENRVPQASQSQPLTRTSPMYRDSGRPFSSIKLSTEEHNSSSSTMNGAEAAPPVTHPVLTETFTKSSEHQKFNSKYDRPPHLRPSRNGFKTFIEKRHYIPEAKNTPTYVFDGF